jgi:hypothetical protein
MFVNKDEYHRRYSICKSCPKFDNLFKRCRECNCFMPAKCKLSNSACPDNHWSILDISVPDELEDIETLDLRLVYIPEDTNISTVTVIPQLPYELLWGVDVAVKKLRPGANFQLEGTRFTQWNCPNGSTAPSWDEVMQQLKEDEAAANDWIAANT